MKTPYKHFDLPTHHIGGHDYVPPKEQDSSEIDRLHGLPHGTLLLEKQHHGLLIATRMIELLDDEPDLEFAGSLVASSGFNASWYSYGRDGQMNRMRRRLELINLTDPETLLPQDADIVKQRLCLGLASAAELASHLATLHAEGRSTHRTKFALGKTLGTLSTGLANITATAIHADSTPRQLSESMRWNASKALEQSRQIVPEGSTHPSYAQFAEHYSDLSVAIHRHAPRNVKRALAEAQEEYEGGHYETTAA